MQIESIIFSLDDNSTGIISTVSTILYDPYESKKFRLTKGKVNIEKFSDAESSVSLLTSVRGKRVYLLSAPNDADKVLQLNFAIDAAKRAGAKEIIPILTYFPYSRSDKKDQDRGSISAKVIAEMIEHRGATSLVAFDLHAEQIQGFFNIPVIHMDGKYLFGPYMFKNMDLTNVVLCSPDAGGIKRVKHLRDFLSWKYNINLSYVTIDKTRVKANQVDKMVIIGDVKDKHVVILDDLVDTAGTLCLAAKTLKEEGGAKSVTAMATHGVLSDGAYKRIESSLLDSFICSNTLPVQGKGEEKITVLSIARQVIKAIYAIDTNQSLENLNTLTKLGPLKGKNLLTEQIKKVINFIKKGLNFIKNVKFCL